MCFLLQARWYFKGMTIADNLKRIRSEKKLSQAKLAKEAGVSQQLISQLENSVNSSTTELPKLARALGVSVSEIDPSYGDVSNEVISIAGRMSPVRTIGVVEAGAFREVDEFDQGEPEEIYLPPDTKYPNARQMAFVVAGDSMNNLDPRPILPGDRAVCVAYADIAAEVKLRDGMVVVVQRQRDGGHFREWSIKQIELYEDRTVFAPRSTNPKHKPIIVPRDFDADNGEEVEVIALLRRVVNDYDF